MRILFNRHGDPHYINDTLTKIAHREAKLLAERAADLNLGSCYVSPLGRAKDTAQYCLDKVGKTAQTVEWLREFPARIDLNQAVHLQKAYPTAEKENGRYVPRIVWDIVPSYWMEHGECMDRDAWRKSDLCQNSDAVEVYDRVTLEFDRFLAEHGYVREGSSYRVERECTETVTFFCHFGITCALLSHLWNMSPFSAWQYFAFAPTSVTEIVTEEREKGIACFRGLKLGDASHLYAGNEPVSVAARFCEVYSDMNSRH